MDLDEDLQLLERWRADDKSAGERLCTRYFAEIYRFFEHKIAGEADDLTQQTFLSCVRARDQFRAGSSFRTYLFTIAKNVFYMRLRQKARHEHVDLDTSSLEEIVSSPGPELGREQELARVRAALRRLSVSQQVLLELHYWHELDAAALAELFETSPGAIRVRLLRARRTLRARLLAGGDGPRAGDPLSSSLDDPELDRDE